LMTLSLFSVLFLSGINNSQQKYLINWSGLFDRNLCIAISFALILYSIAGIPPLSGFYSKLCILFCLLSQGQVCITIIVAIFSSIACFYYIRVIKVLFFTSDSKTQLWIGSGTGSIEPFLSLSLTIITLFLLRPNFLIDCATMVSLALN
jgi:NADH-quinone oxidoreductase subunit N